MRKEEVVRPERIVSLFHLPLFMVLGQMVKKLLFLFGMNFVFNGLVEIRVAFRDPFKIIWNILFLNLGILD